MPHAASATPNPHHAQQVTRLTPLADVLHALDAIAQPAQACEVDVEDAAGFVLAADVHAQTLPVHAVALRDGYAVRAEELADAGGYAPVVLPSIPRRLEIGDALPPDADAVAPPDTIVVNDHTAEALQPITAGDGVLPIGAEVDQTKSLLSAGESLHAARMSALCAAGVRRVAVRRPRLRLIAAHEDRWLQATVAFIAQDCKARGAQPYLERSSDLEQVLRQDTADAIIIVGGSGSGTRDRSVSMLARLGRVVVHGIGLTPGETGAIGSVADRPVLVVPGRLDAGLAVWLVLGRHLLRKLTARRDHDAVGNFILSRKISSTVGFTEVIPVRCEHDHVEPLAAKHWPLSALARANGWVLVPPESEGFAAGSSVTVNSLP